MSGRSADNYPRPAVAKHRIQHGEELPRDRDQGGHFALSPGNQMLVKGPENGIMFFGDHRAHEQRRAYAGTSSTDKTLAAPLAGGPGEGGQSGKAGDLPSVERPKLWQFRQKRTCDSISNARNAGQKFVLFLPNRRASHAVIDVSIDGTQFLLERLDQAYDAFFSNVPEDVARDAVRRRSCE